MVAQAPEGLKAVRQKHNTGPIDAGKAILRIAAARSWTLGFVAGLLSLAPLVFMFQVYGNALQTQNTMSLWAMLALLIWVLCITEILNHLRSRTLLKSVRRALAYIEESWAQMQKTDPVRFAGLHQAVVRDTELLRAFLTGPGTLALFELPVTLLFLGFVGWIHPLLLAITALAAGIMISLGVAGLSEADKSQTAQTAKDATNERWLSRAEINQGVMVSMGMTTAWREAWQRQLEATSNASARTQFSLSATNASQRALQLLVGSVLLGVGAALSIQDSLQGGPAMLIVATALGAKVLAPVSIFTSQVKNFLMARAALKRLQVLFETNTQSDNGLRLPPPTGHLRVTQITVTPGGFRGNALRGVSLDLPPGDRLGLLGQSGSGKSSLLKAIAGIHKPESGEIRLDGADLTTWRKDESGQYIGYVPQLPSKPIGPLWNWIIRDPDKNFTTAEALKERFPVGWFDFVDKLADGWLTDFSTDDPYLSRGELQRISIATAFSPTAKLLLLDQPETGLDEGSIKDFTEVLRRANQEGISMILVTAREDWLKESDQLLLLEAGRPKLYGPSEQVRQTLLTGSKK